MKSYLTVSCYAGNYRTQPARNQPKPNAFARGIFGSKRQADAYAAALADYYGQDKETANVMYFGLEYDPACRRYSLTV